MIKNYLIRFKSSFNAKKLITDYEFFLIGSIVCKTEKT